VQNSLKLILIFVAVKLILIFVAVKLILIFVAVKLILIFVAVKFLKTNFNLCRCKIKNYINVLITICPVYIL
jgi:hypothetical protein